MQFKNIDIFCQVIDNFGDAGVVYRFAKEFKVKHSYSTVRVFIDNLHVLQSIERSISTDCLSQNVEDIIWIDSTQLTPDLIKQLGTAEIIIEAFACQIPECYMEHALFNQSLIINLEYLSAEEWVEGYHLKESLLSRGNSRKFFFMPGFSTGTGGLIFNSWFKNNKAAINSQRADILRAHIQKSEVQFQTGEPFLIGTVFTYQRGFDAFLRDLESLESKIILLVFGEKSQNSMSEALNRIQATRYNSTQWMYRNISVIYKDFITQNDYDTLLYCSDFNLVRGEDSLVRAIMAEKPFIWNAYIQEKKYQKIKVEALLKSMQPFFDDEHTFMHYRDLMLTFNDAEFESTNQSTTESYQFFLKNLNNFEHATSKMCYFIERNCNLIEKLSGFIRDFQ